MLWFITLDVSLHLLVDDIVLSLCVLSVSSCFAVVDLVLYILPGFGFGQGFYGDPFFVLNLISAKYLLVCIYPCLFPLLRYIFRNLLLVFVPFRSARTWYLLLSEA